MRNRISKLVGWFVFTVVMALVLGCSGCDESKPPPAQAKPGVQKKKPEKKQGTKPASKPKVENKIPDELSEKKIEYKIHPKQKQGAATKGINVVWFMIDSLRADHLGCYGYDKDTTPFIDGFAKKGILFKNAMTPESYTLAAAASYFTSTYPIANQVLYDSQQMDVLAPKFVTIAEILGLERYYTAAFVFDAQLKRKTGFHQGFDVYDDNPEGWPKDTALHEKYETSRKIFEKTERFLKENQERPVFIYAHYRDVHSPYAPPPPYHEMFLPQGSTPVVDACYPSGKADEPIDMQANLDLFKSQYDGEIRYTDSYIEKTIELLKTNGITAENTIFIIASNHGEEFYDKHPGDPGGYSHGRTLYGDLIHVPLVLSLPNINPKKRSIESYVSLMDIVPTILEYLGLNAKKIGQFKGNSLMRLIEKGSDENRPIYSGGAYGRGMIIENGWKYIRSDKQKKSQAKMSYGRPKADEQYTFTEELYSLQADPKELSDLVTEHPIIAEKMKSSLKKAESDAQQTAALPALDIDKKKENRENRF